MVIGHRERGLTLRTATLAEADKGYIETNVAKNRVLFQGFKDDDLANYKTYESLEITLEFDVAESVVEGTAYNVTVESVDVTNIDEGSYVPSIDAGFAHIHKFAEEGTESEDGTYTTHKCVLCDVVETKLKEKVDVSKLEPNNLKNTGAYNITFQEDGGLALNFLNTEHADGTYVAVLGDDNTIDELMGKAGVIVEAGAAYHGYQYDYENGVKTIAETVQAVYVTTDGNGKIISASTPVEVSVAKYCEDVIKNSDKYNEKIVAYCQALLNYAAAVQDEFSYEGTKVVLGEYAKEYDVELSAENNKETGDSKVVDLMLREVSMTTKPVVRLYFAIDEDKLDTVELTFNYNDTPVVVPASQLVKCVRTNPEGKKVDLYYYDIKNIPAKMMRDVITVTATDGGEALDYTATYSVEAYASKINKPVTKLLMAYSDALYAYYQK